MGERLLEPFIPEDNSLNVSDYMIEEAGLFKPDSHFKEQLKGKRALSLSSRQVVPSGKTHRGHLTGRQSHGETGGSNPSVGSGRDFSDVGNKAYAGSPSRAAQRLNGKYFRRPGESWLTVGRDIGLEEVVEYNMTALVGKFSYHAMNRRDIVSWVLAKWRPLLNYTPQIFALACGWYGFKFDEEAHCNLIMERLWLHGSGSLMLQKWQTDFDPETASVRLRHLWVLLPGLPLALWNRGAFEAIGNCIGRFLHVADEHLNGFDRRMGRVLVEVDISLGLIDVLNINWRGRKFSQIIDYWGIPFRCSNCKEVGHLWRQCSAPASSRRLKEGGPFWSSDEGSDIELDTTGSLDGFSNRVPTLDAQDSALFHN